MLDTVPSRSQQRVLGLSISASRWMRSCLHLHQHRGRLTTGSAAVSGATLAHYAGLAESIHHGPP